MTTRKAAAKKAPAKASSRPSPAARLDALERENAEQRQQIADLETKVNNLAQFIAAGVAQQLQTQLMGSPDLIAQFAALADQQAQAGG